MQVDLSTPEHGWLTAELNGIRLDVSDVPCDSLSDLVRALVHIQNGQASASVDWSLEPEYGAWIFRQEAAQVEVLIRENSKCESVVVADLPRSQFVRKMINALRRLEGNLQIMNDDDADIAWSWPFPSLELERLRNLAIGEQDAESDRQQ